MEKKFAVIQRGYSVFGIGNTREAAVADAAKWLHDENGVQGTTPQYVEELVDEYSGQRVHGGIEIISSDSDEWDDYVVQ